MNLKKHIANHVRGIPRSGIRDFFEIVQTMDDVISLGIGEPDFDTPWHIREAAIYSLEQGRTGYTSNLGLPKLREAISEYVAKHFHTAYDPNSEIIVTVGVSEAIDLALRALVNPGDEVLFHEPCYVSYSPSTLLAHGVPVSIPTFAADNFRLTARELEKKITPASKVLMLNFPCNPTGATQTRAELAKIAALCARHDLIVLTDEIYSELTYDGAEHLSIAAFPGMRERTVLPARIFQGIRDDRLAHRLCLRARDAHRRNDENPPIRDHVRLNHRAGRRHRGARKRRPRRGADAP